MNRMTTVICSLVVALSALTADPCTDPKCPDAGFGANGRVTVDFRHGNEADRGNAVVRVPGEDRLYVIGQVSTAITGDDDFGVVCLLDDGSPCPDFGALGTTTVAMDFTSGGLDAAIAGAVLPWGVGRDWRLVVVGQVEATSAADTDFGIALLRPDGLLETTASGGKVRVAFDAPGTDFTDLPAAVAVTADGKILVGGTVDVATGDTDWGFTRLNSNLTIDTGWGANSNGRVTLNVDGLAVMHAMILQPDGKIVAVGSRDFGGDDQMVIARINADGSPDTFFGFLGQTVFDFDLGGADNDAVWGVAIDPEGRLVLSGQADSSTVRCLASARVLPDGQPDSSFNGGVATRSWCLPSWSIAGRVVAAFDDGHLTFVLEFFDGGSYEFAITDRDPSGSFDLDVYSYPFYVSGSTDDRPRGVLIQPDGKVVIAGRVLGPGGDLDFGVLRLFSHQIFADGFEAWGSAAEWDSIVTAP